MFKTVLPLAFACVLGSADFCAALAMPVAPDVAGAAAPASDVILARGGRGGGGRGGGGRGGGGFAHRGGGGVAHRGYGMRGGGMRYGGRYGHGGRYAGGYHRHGYGWGAAAVGAAAGAAATGAYYNNNGCHYDSYGRWVCPPY